VRLRVGSVRGFLLAVRAGEVSEPEVLRHQNHLVASVDDLVRVGERAEVASMRALTRSSSIFVAMSERGAKNFS
jgi:hypothetical protein